MAKAKTTKTTAKAASTAKATTKNAKAAADKGIERFTEASEFASEFAATNMATFNEVLSNSASTLREIGERNFGLMTRTIEQGMETRQAMSDVRDVREAVELQSTFAKSVFSEYTQELNAQAELYTGMWRDAMKPFQKQMAESIEKFQAAR